MNVYEWLFKSCCDSVRPNARAVLECIDAHSEYVCIYVQVSMCDGQPSANVTDELVAVQIVFAWCLAPQKDRFSTDTKWTHLRSHVENEKLHYHANALKCFQCVNEINV